MTMAALWCLWALTVQVAQWNLVATEGEEWSIPLHVQQPNQTFGFQVYMENADIWVENPFRFSLFSTTPHSASPSTVQAKFFSFPDQQELVLVCHSNTVQAFLRNGQFNLLWQVSLGHGRIIQISQFWLDSQAFAFLLLETAAGLQVVRLNVTLESPEPPAPVTLAELEAAETAVMTVLPLPVQYAALVLSCSIGDSSVLHMYELTSSLSPQLRQSYSSLPDVSGTLHVQRLFQWACDLYILEASAGLLAFTLIDFHLAVPIPLNLNAYGQVAAVTFPQNSATDLAVTTSEGLLLHSTVSQDQHWVPGPVLAAEVVDGWVFGLWLREDGVRFEVFSLKGNRTEGSWPMPQTAPFHVISELNSNAYTLVCSDEDAVRFYRLETGNRVLHGRAEQGHYSGTLQGAELTTVELEVLSASDSSILCGSGYFLTSHLELELPVEQRGVSLRLDRLFSGPDLRMEVSSDSLFPVPKLVFLWTQSVTGLSTAQVLDSLRGDKVLLCQDSRVHIFQHTGTGLIPTSSYAIPGLQAAVLRTTDLLALVISSGHSYLRSYTEPGKIIKEVEVSQTCISLQANDLYIKCLGPTQVDILSTSLDLLIQLTAKSLGTEEVDFKAVEIVRREAGLSVLVACGVNGLMQLILVNGYEIGEKVETGIRDVLAMRVYGPFIVSMLTVEGKIAIYETRVELKLLKTLPAWESGEARQFLHTESFLGVVKQDRLYLYNVLEPVHNSLFTSVPVHRPCSYFLHSASLLELCPDSLSLWGISQYFRSPHYPAVLWTRVSDSQTQLTVQANNDKGAFAAVRVLLKK